MALAKNIFRPAKFPTYRARLRQMMPDIQQSASDFSFDLGCKTLLWALNVNKNRGVPKDEFFSDRLALTKALVELVGADAVAIYAAFLYSAMRPDEGAHFDTTYLDDITQLFKGEDGVIDGNYIAVKDLIVNVLRVRAIDLIAPPNPITSVDEAFEKPGYDEAQNLAAYYILSRNIAKDSGAFAIRATEWYLRLVDMRENPARYSQEDRLHAYYFTDKFYAPYCEYLALQKLEADPTYSPSKEVKGLYRLKTAMEEELIRQINPTAYREIQEQLHTILRGFEIVRGVRKPTKEAKLSLFETVRVAIEEILHEVVQEAGIPQEFVRIESRLKKPRGIYQKIRAGRDDIHDYIGFRMVIDVEKYEGKRHGSTSEKKARHELLAKMLCGKLHAIMASRFETVPKRYRNTYVDPYKPDNGYRTVANTFKFFGQDVEIQFVGLNEHICNCIGTASHFFHKIVGSKKGEKETGLTTLDMMTAFVSAGSRIVVRTPRDLHVLRSGATAADLAEKIHTDLRNQATEAIVTDHDPLNRLENVRVPLSTPLRDGQFVEIEKRRSQPVLLKAVL